MLRPVEYGGCNMDTPRVALPCLAWQLPLSASQRTAATDRVRHTQATWGGPGGGDAT